MNLYNKSNSLIRKNYLPRRPLISASLVKASMSLKSFPPYFLSLLDLRDFFIEASRVYKPAILRFLANIARNQEKLRLYSLSPRLKGFFFVFLSDWLFNA